MQLALAFGGVSDIIDRLADEWRVTICVMTVSFAPSEAFETMTSNGMFDVKLILAGVAAGILKHEVGRTVYMHDYGAQGAHNPLSA
eukprot:6173439-Pleurochrysis_carterae.AAC.2